MSDAVLCVDNLTIGFPDAHQHVVPVVRDVRMQIHPGARIGIVGESGCGKSTLAYALLGWLRGNAVRVQGTVTLAGADMFAMPEAQLQQFRGARVALVPQNAGQALAPHRTVYQHIAEVLEIHGTLPATAVRQRVMHWLHAMQFRNPAQIAQRYPHQLSGGQQQRVAVAMALAGEPQVLVLDEPTTGLDVTTQTHLLALLHRLTQDTQLATVLVSHDLGVIAQMCTHVMVMYAGEVVEQGVVTETFRQPHHPYTRGLLAALPDIHDARLPVALRGQLHSMTPHQSHCVFRDRCDFAQPVCDVAPSFIPVTPERAVRCHRWQDVVNSPHPASDAVPVVLTPLPADAVPRMQLHQVSATYQQSTWRWWARPPVPLVIDQINVQVYAGHTCAIVGESGSGKSTIARVATGLHPALTGDVLVANERVAADVTRRHADERRRVQLIFQNPDASLNPRHTVEELLYRPQAVFFGRTRDAARTQSLAMLAQMRLDASYLTRLPRQLSGGEKQRVAIARAFLAEPDVVVCDEVVSALDVSVQAAILQLLVVMQQQRGTSMLFISHDLAVVRAIAHHVVVLYAGHICEQGTTDQVFATPYHPYTVMLLQAAQAARHTAPMTIPLQPVGTPDVGAGGCPFRHRCAMVIPHRCAEIAPPWQSGAAGHTFRCHHAADDMIRLRHHQSIHEIPQE